MKKPFKAKFSIIINLVWKVFHWLLMILKFCLCYKMLEIKNKNIMNQNDRKYLV